jgi:hypothetical protein
MEPESVHHPMTGFGQRHLSGLEPRYFGHQFELFDL